jgi:hypothetical protein
MRWPAGVRRCHCTWARIDSSRLALCEASATVLGGGPSSVCVV